MEYKTNLNRWTMLKHLMEDKRDIKSIKFKEYHLFNDKDEYIKALDKHGKKGKNFGMVLSAVFDGIITLALVEYEIEKEQF